MTENNNIIEELKLLVKSLKNISKEYLTYNNPGTIQEDLDVFIGKSEGYEESADKLQGIINKFEGS